MTEHYRYKLVKISSFDKEVKTDSNSNFSVDLSGVSQQNLKNIIGVSLKEAAFVNCFPNIRTGINDTISILQNGQTRKDITIPQGFYSGNVLVQKLTTEINNVLFGETVNIVFDPYDQRLIFTISSGTIVIYSDTLSNLADTLGFKDTTTANLTNKADYIVKLNGVEQAFIHLDVCDDSLIDVYHGSHHSVLQVINMNSEYLATQYYEASTSDRIIFTKTKDLNRIWKIRLTNSIGEELDLQHFDLKLIISVFY